MKVIDGIPVWGDPDQETVNQMKEAMKYDAVFGALMADHHLGYTIPVGAVIAYEGRICVNGVGFDIGCGNKAVRLDVDACEVRLRIAEVMDKVQKEISFGVGRTNNERVDHEIFDETMWEEIPLLGSLKDKARQQLGTVGSGNHYVDVFIDEMDRVWVGVHFGSRGLGHSIATHFLKQQGGQDGTYAKPVLLSDASEAGREYIACMEMAGRYASAGRDWVCERVAKILGGQCVEAVHNHHNFAWRESHFDRDLWVVRKGATPCFPGQKGFVGGSMGEISVILQGKMADSRQDGESASMLHSTIHGSGRTLGRSQAKGKRDKRGNIIREAAVTPSQMREWLTRAGVELRGADVDESPHCYKRIKEVLGHHADTIDILHVLRPIGVCMAGASDHDPYKD